VGAAPMRTTSRVSTAGLLLLVIGIAVACQASASPSPSSDAAASGALPSLVGAPDLEATLPSEAGGIVFQSFSMSGPDFVGAEIDEQFVTFLNSLGADVDQVSVAIALGANAAGDQTASIFAFQVAGAQAADLTDQFKASAEGCPPGGTASPAESCGAPLVWTPGTVGGKAVEVAEPNADFQTPIAMYAVDETIYFVSTTDPAAFEAILSALPPVAGQ
jgi:hypothetical protein